jgi:hypothetical protein
MTSAFLSVLAYTGLFIGIFMVLILAKKGRV